ncbi:MAG: biopolymer transporter ExbD [Planctomycetes bacterium]|nr:biopolymer transporter ExbD [Planctomycetota bacterium]
MKFKRRPLEVTAPYVSMADIAFNLVLFFLIMAKTQDDSNRIEWDPARSTGAQPVKNAKVTVTVDKGQVILDQNGKPTMKDGKPERGEPRLYFNGQQVGMRDLTEKVAAALGDKPPTERIVVLKIHNETLASTFEPIMEAVSQAGGEVVHVIEEERPN